MPDRQIVALGGGGFSMEQSPVLDDFILRATGKDEPRVCFVPTASGDSERYLLNFYKAFAPRRCRPTHLALFDRTVTDLRQFVLSQDVIYVGGGNTANLLVVWRRHGLAAALRDAWEAGVVLCGISAGALCWFECGVTDSFGPPLAPLTDGLGFLPGSFCPHYDGETDRRPVYRRLVGEGILPDGLAADDSCGLHFVGTTLQDVVASRPGAHAYRVQRGEAGSSETVVPARLLA